MGHGPAVKLGKDNAAAYKSKIGISMFFVYTLTYFGFVVINAVNPALMEKVYFGQTLAVLYGFFLIVASNNTLSSNDACGNSFDAFQDEWSIDNVFVDNVFCVTSGL